MGFYSDPFGPTNGGDLGLGADVLISDIGPQSDGTYGTPTTAQLYNAPDNNAGYAPSISPTTAALLSQGIGSLTQLGLGAMTLDYRKAEATNGGLFYQGQYAALRRNGYGQINQPITLSTMLLLGGLAYLLLKD